VREPATHKLKTWPEYYEAIIADVKLFELRVNDRDFQVGDYLDLQEWDPKTCEYTGRSTLRHVLYILRGPEFGIAEGYVAMSIV
jgi:hypothetical protein